MAKIKDILCAPGVSGFFFDDQEAIRSGAIQDGFVYKGSPVIPGFKSIRQAGESISVILLLDDGQIAYGDCCAVQYSGAGGRDPVFIAKEFMPLIKEEIVPCLINEELTNFRMLAERLDSLTVNGKPIHTAIRYGITQAILDGVAKSKKKLMCDVIGEEYNLDIEYKPVKIFSQSGDERYINVDKMILKQVDVLPHGLINNIPEKLGEHGEKLKEYIEWIKNRIYTLRPDPSYNPIIHIDVYGTIGIIFENNMEKIIEYLRELEENAYPFKLRIEEPVDMGNREDQIKALQELSQKLKEKDIHVEIVADEWCNTLEDIKLFAENRAGDIIQIKMPDLGGINNTIEAVLECKRHDIGTYLGGSCNETDRSAQVSVHIGMATQPDQILAKPGMGVDEGYTIVYNEMQRILILANSRVG